MSTTPLSRSTRFSDLLAADPSRQAFVLLRTVFTVAPIVFGLDKFANVLVDWPGYLAPVIDDLLPGTAQQVMYAVGVIEIVAGIVVAWRPLFGSLLVSAWLLAIIVDLLLIPGYYDIALRDFGLLAGALALSRLSAAHAHGASGGSDG